MSEPPREDSRRRAGDARFAFKHRLTADSARAALLRQNRRALHSVAADALAARIVRGSGNEPAMQREVIYHLSHAGRYREAHERAAYIAGVFANSGSSEREIAGLLARSAELWEQARADDSKLPPSSPHLLLAEGILRRQQGRLDESRAALSASASLAEAAGDTALACMAHNALGNMHWHRNDLDSARAAFSEAMRLAQAAGDPWLELPPRFNLARTSHVAGDNTAALRQGEEAILLARQCASQRPEAFILNLLGVCYGVLGDRLRMRECYESSLELSQLVGERLNAATVKSNLGNEAIVEGRPEEARRWLEDALGDVRELNAPEKLVYIAGRLGEAERQLGQSERAAALLDEALAVAARTGVGRNLHLVYIAQCELSLDKADAAGALRWLAAINGYMREHQGWDVHLEQEAAGLEARVQALLRTS